MNMYKDVTQVSGDLEFDVTVLETVILNGRNEKINRFLLKAIDNMKYALAALSDAEFEIFTTPGLYDDDNDEDADDEE